jgi:hypothetical protein
MSASLRNQQSVNSRIKTFELNFNHSKVRYISRHFMQASIVSGKFSCEENKGFFQNNQMGC